MEIEVAVPTPLPRTFTYRSPAKVRPGQRVMVPFARRKLVGVVLAEAKPEPREFKLKDIVSVIDEEPIYGQGLLELAKWMSRYYLHPIGEVLKTMLPASKSAVSYNYIELTERGSQEKAQIIDSGLAKVFGKKSRLTATTVKDKLKRLGLEESVEAWIDRGLVSRAKSTKVKARVLAADAGESATSEAAVQALELTEDQKAVFAELRKGLGSEENRPFLLRGVTGSGKTEIYLQLIQELLEKDESSQVLVLVPEISLTPQMTRVFVSRFPGLVAVVHSAMPDAERWSELTKVGQGQARVLIGPRSAVFAPFRKLALIVVDEEHDASYKQTSGLTYNGRDVAVLRAKIEGAMVVLGSATPALESFANAEAGKYKLVSLDKRVSGRALPQVEVVKVKPAYKAATLLEKTSDGSAEADAIAAPIMRALEQNHQDGNQAIVLVNRRGFAHYLYNLDKKQPVQCPNCSISMTLHQRSARLHCHYCDHATTTKQIMRDAPSEHFAAVGYGSQQVEDVIRDAVPGIRVSRLDSDVAAKRGVLHDTLGRFRKGEIDVLVGTQMLAKGHDFPKVTLVALIEIDQLLDLPDFRAGERTFQLLVQAAGRAGRADLPGRVMMQTTRPEHDVLKDALEQDYLSFARRELEARKVFGYPPFQRMVLVELSTPTPRDLSMVQERIERWLEASASRYPHWRKQLRILGPAIPGIEVIRKRYRRTLIASSVSPEVLRELVSQFQHAFSKLPAEMRVKYDIDPQSIL